MHAKEIRRKNLLDIIEKKVGAGREFPFQEDFAAFVGIIPSYLSQMIMEPSEKGARGVSEAKAALIEEKLGLALGSMNKPMWEEPLYKDGFFDDHGILRPNQSLLSRHTQDGVLSSLDASLYVLVPQFDVAGACGLGRTNEVELIKGGLIFKEEWLRKKGISPKHGCSGVMYGDGESMIPTVYPDNILLGNLAINTYDQVTSDKVYAFVAEKELRIKRFFKEKGGLRIVSDHNNKIKYPDEYLSREELNTIKIVAHLPWRAGDI